MVANGGEDLYLVAELSQGFPDYKRS
jgi:hypothetical protein